VALDAHAPIPEVEVLRQLLAKALAGEVDLNLKIADRIRHFKSYPGIPVAAPVVRAINDQASNATVLEVRMHDRPGLLYNVAKVISRFGVDIRGAIVATLGAEAFDTLYITDLAGAPLSGERAALLANQVENFLLTD
jgi:[protein-PII] uridylyltransferase